MSREKLHQNIDKEEKREMDDSDLLECLSKKLQDHFKETALEITPKDNKKAKKKN